MHQESEKIRIHPAGAGEFVPEMRRLHAASMEGTVFNNPRHSGKAQKAQYFAPAHSLFALPRWLRSSLQEQGAKIPDLLRLPAAGREGNCRNSQEVSL